MAVRHGYGKIAGADALVFAYDTGDTINSYKGEPTINYIPETYPYGLYARASGPVDISTLNEKNQTITAKRYTITSAINAARGAIFITSVTTGVFYTFSIKWKYNGATTTSPLFLIDATKGNPEVGGQNTYSSSTIITNAIGNGWYLSTFIFSFSASLNNGAILTFGISTGTTSSYVGETFDVYEAQFEIKNHKTPYSNGTRSATQGLLDLTGKGTIDLTNLSFDGDAQMIFDGINDYFLLSDPGVSTSFSIEFVVKVDNYSNSPIFISPNSQGIDHFFRFNSSGTIRATFVEIPNSSADNYTSSTVLSTSKYYHVVMSKSPLNGTLYINGTAEDSHTPTLPAAAWTSYWRIGARNNGTAWFTGKLPVLKVYNRVLTAGEVLVNYNHYRTRFNL
jgi:hypothetical protein